VGEIKLPVTSRGLESVETEASFICLALNFKRLINILEVKELIKIKRAYPFNMLFVNFMVFKNVPGRVVECLL
jgi:hypothetical protein